MTRFSLFALVLAVACSTESNLGNTPGAGSDAGSSSADSYTPFTTTRWALTFGGSGADVANGVAIDATSGDVIAGGIFGGTVDFGDTSATTVGTGGWVSRRAAADGHARWTFAITADGSSSVSVAGVATTGSGDIVIAGPFYGTAAIGSDTLTSTTMGDGEASFVAELDGSGVPRWATVLDANIDHVAAGADGRIAVTAVFTGSLAFPNGTLVSSTLQPVIAAYAPDGSALWGVAATDADSFNALNGLAMTAEDDIVVSGVLEPTSQIAGVPIAATSADQSSYVARLSIAGDVVWATPFGATGFGYTSIDTLAIAPDGATLAGELLSEVPGDGQGVPGVARFDATGAASWQFVGSAFSSSVSTIAATSDGHAVEMSPVGLGLDLGAGRISGCVYQAQLDSSGVVTGELAFDNPASNICEVAPFGLATGSGNSFAMAGEVASSVDLGTGPLRWDGSTSGSNQNDNPDAVIAVFDPR